MRIKSLKVIDGHQNSSSYSYSDESGSHDSIKVNEYVTMQTLLT